MPSLPPGIVINDPQNLDFVFKNERLFAKGAFMTKPLWDLFGLLRFPPPPIITATMNTGLT